MTNSSLKLSACSLVPKVMEIWLSPVVSIFFSSVMKCLLSCSQLIFCDVIGLPLMTSLQEFKPRKYQISIPRKEFLGKLILPVKVFSVLARTLVENAWK